MLSEARMTWSSAVAYQGPKLSGGDPRRVQLGAGRDPVSRAQLQMEAA